KEKRKRLPSVLCLQKRRSIRKKRGQKLSPYEKRPESLQTVKPSRRHQRDHLASSVQRTQAP
ncbi:hypothetical protein PIB30_064769, partial [Stylosanthes scabra]|nr:hypothetical protein [Stylosanthes scabra]